MNENEIFRAAKKGGAAAAGGNKSFLAGVNNKEASFVSTSSKGSRGKSTDHKKTNISNEWIPTEAVKVLQRIREDHNSQMTEVCVSQILYELNAIWR